MGGVTCVACCCCCGTAVAESLEPSASNLWEYVCVCVSKDQGGKAILLVCTCTCMSVVRCHNFSAYNIRYSEYLLLQRNKLD